MPDSMLDIKYLIFPFMQLGVFLRETLIVERLSNSAVKILWLIKKQYFE